ncbi:MAG TPA: histidine kinase [Thermoanaerobaculia bacterium]
MTPRTRAVLVSIFAWPLIGALVFLFEAVLSAVVGQGFGIDPEDLRWGFVGWLEWMLLAPLVVLIAMRIAWTRLPLHAVWALVVSTAHSVIFFALRGVPVESMFETWLPVAPRFLSLDLLVYGATVLATHVVIDLEQAWVRHRDEVELERRLARAEHDLLKAQLRPDQLDGALREIEELIEQDTLAAERRINTFSEFLRASLRATMNVEAEAEPEEKEARPSRLSFLRFALVIIALPLTIRALHVLATEGKSLDAPLLSTSPTIDFLVVVTVALAVFAYRRYAVLRERTLRSAELDSRLLRTHSQTLRLQLNPHFLFNALNSIAALLEDDAPAALTMTNRLRAFLHRALASDRQEVTLAEELDLLQAYVEIEKVRFGTRLQLDVSCAASASTAMVPTLVLQPLVENAVRHGLAPVEGGRVSITADTESGALRIEVRNSAVATRTPAREGIGLTNTRTRLRQLYGEAAELRLEAVVDGFRAVVSVPVH